MALRYSRRLQWDCGISPSAGRSHILAAKPPFPGCHSNLLSYPHRIPTWALPSFPAWSPLASRPWPCQKVLEAWVSWGWERPTAALHLAFPTSIFFQMFVLPGSVINNSLLALIRDQTLSSKKFVSPWVSEEKTFIQDQTSAVKPMLHTLPGITHGSQELWPSTSSTSKWVS